MTILTDEAQGRWVAPRTVAIQKPIAVGKSEDPILPIKNRGYRVVLADPPWRFELHSAKGEAKSAQAHYRCLDLPALVRIKDQIALDFICAENCALVMWATFPMLREAIALMHAWGFAYKTGGAWFKRYASGAPVMGTGYIYRSACEPWILGTRGAPRINSHSIRNVIDAERREHSRKPDQMHDMLERQFDGPYLELFARRRRTGWTCWGDQL